MTALYRIAAGSIWLLLAQSFGGFWPISGLPQSAPAAAVATAQELPGRAPPAVPDEILIIFRDDAPPENFARDYGLTHLYSYYDALIGKTVHHYRITSRDVPIASRMREYRMRSTSPRSDRGDGSAKEKSEALSTAEYISLLSDDPRIESVQPNYIYQPEDDFSWQPDSETTLQVQYVLAKLKIREAHRLSTGCNVKVAVIDSEIDATHPELRGAVETELKVIGEGGPDKHGTAMAGAIVSHGELVGVAPASRILAVRAFGDTGGTTLAITQGLNWSFASGARIINMSFAGPEDPLLRREVSNGYKQGLILIAAAGNAGANSPPLYPAAYPQVVAVTATDADDRLFGQANTGRYVAMAAPGVDVLGPYPGGMYQLSTGTSIAAAHVSGVAALLLERNPRLTPDEVRNILVATADKIEGSKSAVGRVNAFEALSMMTKTEAGRCNLQVP